MRTRHSLPFWFIAIRRGITLLLRYANQFVQHLLTHRKPIVKTNAQRKIQLAETEAEVRRCWPVFHELRPHLRSEDEFVARWRKQLDEGYRIVYTTEKDAVVAAAGYRFLNTMAWGHILYIDDLVALEAFHGAGLGTLLLQHLQAEARRAGCAAVHLDTGYQRHLAHRSYLRNGFHIHCHHMAWPVNHG